MSYEERRLQSKIHMFEDMLLRSKNQYEIENLQTELFKLRKQLQITRQRESR